MGLSTVSDGGPGLPRRLPRTLPSLDLNAALDRIGDDDASLRDRALLRLREGETGDRLRDLVA